MKVIKATLALLGIAGVVAVVVLLSKFWLDARLLLGAAQRYDSGSRYLDPMVSASIITGVTALSFFVLGLALGLPKQTVGKIRNQTLDQAAAKRQAEIASRAAGTDVDQA
ncbi:MAG: hypothetical protein GX875_07120 [Propionibacterium sp.]|nr:hypothetical protein [Propionibacterium sp.]